MYVTEYVYHPAAKPLHHRALTWALVALLPLAIVAIALPFWPGFAYTVHASWPTYSSNVTSALAEAQAPQPPGPGNWLLIPTIGVKTPIVEGPDIGILDKKDGVWHQTGESSHGNFVLAGHRFKYLPPNQATLYNLDKLKIGERIVIWYNGRRQVYTMTTSKTVSRESTQILNPTTTDQLTLYTCTDLAASKRLVVMAHPSTN